jgi:hypothetical protein
MTITRGLLAAVLLLTGFASAQIFSVTDLGPSVIPAEVNDRGQVAAMRSGVPGGSLWSEETGFADLTPLAGFPLSFTRGINNRGDVVGYSEDEETFSFHATLWLSATRAQMPLMTGAGQRGIWAVASPSCGPRETAWLTSARRQRVLRFTKLMPSARKGLWLERWVTTLPELPFSGPRRPALRKSPYRRASLPESAEAS